MKLSKIGPNFFLALAVLFMAAQAFAAPEAPKLECANEAVKVAVARNFKRYGASTNSCGAKLLTAGEFFETYLVCVSDETDPSEWVVVMKTDADKCSAKFADAQHDSSTPNFSDDSDSALLNVWSCSADHGGNGQVHCQ